MAFNLGHIFAQVVTTIPELPTDSEPVTIIFDASQGDAGLKNFTSEIYAHTGVITQESASQSDWKYTIAEWNENTEKDQVNYQSSKWHFEC